MPNPTIEHELAEFSQISRSQPQSAGCSSIAVSEAVPDLILDPERLKKRLFGEFLDWLPRDLPQYQAKQPHAAAVVIPRSPRRRFDRTRQHETIRIRSAPPLAHNVFPVIERNSALGPIQTRGHRQQMTQGNPILLGSAEIGIFWKERDYRGIEIVEPTTVKGDADQQYYDTLG